MGEIIQVDFGGRCRVNRCIGKPSPRENQVLQLWGRGYEADEIAEVLGIGIGTVRTRLNTLRAVVHVETSRELRGVAFAWERGLVRLYVPIERVPVKEPVPRSRAAGRLRAQREIATIVCLT